MDLQFASKLQTALSLLGVTGDFEPSNSQDKANKVLHEYYVAEMGRSMFDKRRKKALEDIKKLDTQGIVATEIENVKKLNMGSSVQLLDTQDFTCIVALKAPSTTLDESLLRVELVKAGLNADKIETAINNARKKNKPAETYNVSLKRT